MKDAALTLGWYEDGQLGLHFAGQPRIHAPVGDARRRDRDECGLYTVAPTLRFGDATRGDVLEYYGSGGIDFGYLGGIYDENTGLIYLGGGQYYDPATGRFLTRGAGQSNPYKPGAFDPAGMMVAPLALIGLALGKKKKRGKWDTFIVLLVVGVVVGMSVSACGGTAGDQEETVTVTITFPSTKTATETPQPTTIPSPTATISIAPTIRPTLWEGCQMKIWYSGFESDTDYLEDIATVIYNEGASSFESPELRRNVFMAQLWALRTLRTYQYYGYSYKEVIDTAMSFKLPTDKIEKQKVFEERLDDNDYVEITRCILNSIPCAYGPNPWTAMNETKGKPIQWISPQNLNRRDSNGNEITIFTTLVPKCNDDDGCQLPDLRSREWIRGLPVVGWVEYFVDLGKFDATGGGGEGYDECYWGGLYFFANNEDHTKASKGVYWPPPTDVDKEILKCPVCVERDLDTPVNINLPPMPELYSYK